MDPARGVVGLLHDTERGRSEVQSRRATALWVDGAGGAELREVDVPEAGPGDVRVRTLWTGISRGTESLVFRGGVPASQHERMRAPFQEGAFPGPVKYGYLNVGVVEEGDDALLGRTVFTLFPHQSVFVVPASAVAVVPGDVPAERAVLAGAAETAVNVLWDAAPLVGDRVSVVGAGMIGCCVARILAGVPGVDVVLVDVDPAKAPTAERLGIRFSTPDEASRDRDLVIHASATEAGLQHALETVITEGEVVEASWFGDRPVRLDLGADFHARRLTIRASQVGAVPPRRSATRSPADRMALALRLLGDPAFDALLTSRSSWRELPDALAAVAGGRLPGLCHTIDWRNAA